MSDLLAAVWGNILSWFLSLFKASHLLITTYPEEEEASIVKKHDPHDNTKCILISRPGGIEQLRIVTLKKGICTLGFNLPECGPAPFVTIDENTPETERKKNKYEAQLPKDCVIIRNKYFSVNYADCCIRWGLYESANKFVGWPIVPGFDVCGEVERVGTSIQDLKVGDKVFGCTLFGAYSSRIVIPRLQLRVVPENVLAMAQASSLPAVSLTALYALYLAGHWPKMNNTLNHKSILIHSAAGGVGSMLIQMSKILGLSPIVGVVGNSSKVSTAKALGCDLVIDKSHCNWKDEAHNFSPDGYGCVMDANGVSTLQQSYDLLAPTGRLIVFGFHTNLPIGKSMLSPMAWFGMGYKMLSMPKYDPMELCTSNKSILGFNLSFLSTERVFCTKLMDQIYDWLLSGELICSDVTEFNMEDIANAHSFIQSGKSVGKLVIKVD